MKAATPPADAIPLPIARPTEAEIRAEDLENDDLGAQDPSDHEERQARIRRAAYEAAERRGFEPGHDVEDWLAAEAEIDRKPRP